MRSSYSQGNGTDPGVLALHQVGELKEELDDTKGLVLFELKKIVDSQATIAKQSDLIAKEIDRVHDRLDRLEADVEQTGRHSIDSIRVRAEQVAKQDTIAEAIADLKAWRKEQDKETREALKKTRDFFVFTMLGGGAITVAVAVVINLLVHR
jgi:hypothetical protein